MKRVRNGIGLGFGLVIAAAFGAVASAGGSGVERVSIDTRILNGVYRVSWTEQELVAADALADAAGVPRNLHTVWQVWPHGVLDIPASLQGCAGCAVVAPKRPTALPRQVGHRCR
jgi:hypothetical protein